jgi:hypothetical protein
MKDSRLSCLKLQFHVALNQKAFYYSLIVTLTKSIGGQEEEEEEVAIGVLAPSSKASSFYTSRF